MRNIDETILVNKNLPKSWTCPHCGKRNLMGKYKEEEFIEFFKTMQHCERCGYVHIWFLKLTEDFKKGVVDYLGLFKKIPLMLAHQRCANTKATINFSD